MTHPVLATSVAISLGGHVDLAIGKDNHLYIVHESDSNDPTLISLGEATAHRFQSLISYLERMSIHAIDV
jgi:glycerophosphoryl diester phosphodiesterase